MAIIAKTRTIKVPDEVWERWQAEAKAAGCSTTALIIARTEYARREEIAELRAETVVDEMITALDAKLAELESRIVKLEASPARGERPTLRPVARPD